MTALAYSDERHGFALQRTVTVGGVGSGTSVNVAALEIAPDPLVAVTVSGASGALGLVENVYVRLGPLPRAVKPAIVGKV